MYPWFWLIVLAVLIVIEICTLALTTIWFAGGAFAAFLVSCFTDNIALECILFVVVSAALLLFLRPSVVRKFNRKRTKTNIEAAAGKSVRVIEEVNNLTNSGRVTVGGMEWTARSSEEGVTFAEGETATVVRVEGVKLIIAKEA